MSTKVKEQLGLEDVLVEDRDLELLLEARESLKGKVSEYKKRDKEAKAKISTMSVPTPFRIGRFIIAKQSIQPRSVAFDIDGGDRISIKVVGDREKE